MNTDLETPEFATSDDVALPDSPPQGDTLAGSLAAVGYAMFALLQPGPLRDIVSMKDIVDRLIPSDLIVVGAEVVPAQNNGEPLPPISSAFTHDETSNVVLPPPAPRNSLAWLREFSWIEGDN